uniref:Protein kinase domain-containing protein n=1 Tax=viral metagenome TaxID=1070528 RepID=A0A6C0K9K4_9ZZZZ
MIAVRDLVGDSTNVYHHSDVVKIKAYGEYWCIPVVIETPDQAFYPCRRVGQGGNGIVLEYSNEFGSFAVKVTEPGCEPKSTDVWLQDLTTPHRKSLKRYIIEQKPLGRFRTFRFVAMELLDSEFTSFRALLLTKPSDFTLPSRAVRFDALYKICIALRGLSKAKLGYLDLKLSNIMCNVRLSFAGKIVVKEVKLIDIDGLRTFSKATEASTYPPIECWPLDGAPDDYPCPTETPCNTRSCAWSLGVFVLFWLLPTMDRISAFAYEHLDVSGRWVQPPEHADPTLAKSLLLHAQGLMVEIFPNATASELGVLQAIFDPDNDPRLRSPGSSPVCRPEIDVVLRVLMKYLQRMKHLSYLPRCWFVFKRSNKAEYIKL